MGEPNLESVGDLAKLTLVDRGYMPSTSLDNYHRNRSSQRNTFSIRIFDKELASSLQPGLSDRLQWIFSSSAQPNSSITEIRAFNTSLEFTYTQMQSLQYPFIDS